MTHVVVRKGIFLPEDKLIPVERISTATTERINLRQGVAADELRPFVEQHYLPLDAADRPAGAVAERIDGALTWYGPVGVSVPMPEEHVVTVAERNIPERLAAVEVGVPVFASDHEDVGRLERVIADERGFPTHLVVREDGLMAERRAVPIAWVDDISEDVVALGAAARMVEAIPPLGPDE